MIYYMVTGKNAAGTLINAGQTLTRMEALRLYTANNGHSSVIAGMPAISQGRGLDPADIALPVRVATQIMGR